MQTFLLPALVISLATPALAQAGSVPSPAPAAGSDWSRLQALPPGTRLHLNGKPHTACTFTRADADSVTCARGGGREATYPRAGIQGVKLDHRLRSTLVGLGIGAGTGAIVGFAVGTNNNAFFGKNAFRGGVTGVLAAVGGVLGAPAGYLTDFTAGSSIYRAR